MKKNTSKGSKKYSQLNLEEREEIAVCLEIGLKQCEIALRLQRSPTITISREINNPGACSWVVYFYLERYA
ncbi:MAG: helix-turn-helix domain-containing protein [Treponema sp.]|jgi:IS30 family transposase|nr:helix-turn-helix domain-containing protein [Treponema sp.]